MFKAFFFTVLFLLGYILSFSANDEKILSNAIYSNLLSHQELINDSTLEKESQTVKFKRAKAILFTIFTGIVGGHRVYLGTHQRTPILYAITLGGLGILPFIDLVHLVFTKDLSKFENKPQIIMWKK